MEISHGRPTEFPQPIREQNTVFFSLGVVSITVTGAMWVFLTLPLAEKAFVNSRNLKLYYH